VLGKSALCRIFAGEHLEIILVANPLAGIDVKIQTVMRDPSSPEHLVHIGERSFLARGALYSLRA
jgi:hypothetical protein